jgi:hypothetical protein
MAFFFFGTLMDSEVLGRVLGRPVDDTSELVTARLCGFRCVRARRVPYPILVPGSTAEVHGRLLTDPGRRDERRIIWFEEDEYVPHWHVVTVTDTGQRRRARIFLAVDGFEATTEPWAISHWTERDKATYLEQCEVWMRDCPF